MAVRVQHDIDNLPESWKALLDSAGQESFFSGYGWFATLAEKALAPRTSPRVYGVEADDGTPLLLMVMQTPSAAAGSVLHKNSRREGALSSLTNFFSCEYCPAIGTGVEPSGPMRELALYLRRESSGWSFIEINALDHDSKFFSAAVDALRRAGFLVGVKFNFGNWYEHFDQNSYTDYLKKKPPTFRKVFRNYSRLQRKLESLGELSFKLFKDNQDIEKAIEDFHTVHKQSWKKTEHRDFITELFNNAAKSEKLRMGILYFKGKPVAADVGVLSGRRATMIQTAYDNKFKKYSVGSIVTKLVMEYLLNVDKVAEIDFGRDDQYYKKLWLSERRERWAIVAFNPFRLGAFRLMPVFFGSIFIDRLAEWARPWAKPILH